MGFGKSVLWQRVTCNRLASCLFSIIASLPLIPTPSPPPKNLQIYLYRRSPHLSFEQYGYFNIL